VSPGAFFLKCVEVPRPAVRSLVFGMLFTEHKLFAESLMEVKFTMSQLG
jgi:hypothetical protein